MRSSSAPFMPVMRYLLLLGIPAAVFFQTVHFDFLEYDDQLYITQNTAVHEGLTPRTVKWALTADLTFDSPHSDYWIPVTWLSRLVDLEFFGLDPKGHHATNVLLHLLNTLLIYHLFLRMMGRTGPSLAAALIFAVHPVQAETVAWVTARKDLLGLAFGSLALLAYLRSASGRFGIGWRVATPLLFTLSVMSKPMMVTLPFVMVLLDHWPLDRWRVNAPTRLVSSIIRKWDLWAISACVGGLALFGLRDTSAGHEQNFVLNAGRICRYYLFYLRQWFVPADLAVYGPVAGQYLPGPALASKCIAGLGLLTAAWVWAVRAFPRSGWLLTGPLWFAGTLFLVTGIAWPADRFLYYPMAGLLLFTVMTADALLRGWSARLKPWICAAVVTALAAASFFQVQTWRSTVPLLFRAIEYDDTNYLAHNKLGVQYARAGDHAGAEWHFTRCLQLNPGHVKAYSNLGAVLLHQQKWEQAEKQLLRASRYYPNDPQVWSNLGVAAVQQDARSRAFGYFSRAYALAPHLDAVRSNYENMLRSDPSLRPSAAAQPDLPEVTAQEL